MKNNNYIKINKNVEINWDWLIKLKNNIFNMRIHYFYILSNCSNKYVIFVDYDNMIEKINDVLNNYEEFYNKIYNDFNILSIDNLLKSYLDFFNS